jgi:hypothetical protein
MASMDLFVLPSLSLPGLSNFIARFSQDEQKLSVLCRTYGAQSVGVLNPGLPAWAVSGDGPPGLDSNIHIHLALRLPQTSQRPEWATMRGLVSRLIPVTVRVVTLHSLEGEIENDLDSCRSYLMTRPPQGHLQGLVCLFPFPSTSDWRWLLRSGRERGEHFRGHED